MRMAKREGGNLGSRYPIVDVFREAWRVASGPGSGSEAKAVGSSPSVFAWRSEETLGLPSFIHSFHRAAPFFNIPLLGIYYGPHVKRWGKQRDKLIFHTLEEFRTKSQM